MKRSSKTLIPLSSTIAILFILASGLRHLLAAGFAPTTGSMVDDRYQHTATRLLDGKVLVAGGIKGFFGTLASAELYDPATRTWTQTDPMSTPRSGHTATLLPNGKVLVAGGAGFSAEVYDPSTGHWTPTEPMHHHHDDAAATPLLDGRVLITGGYSIEREDPDLDGDGELTCCDFDGDGFDNYEATPYAEIYNPSTGAWTETAFLMYFTHALHHALLLPNGKVLVMGDGYYWINPVIFGIPGFWLAVSDVYDPVSDTWATLLPLTFANHSRHTGTALPNGNILLTGGQLNWNLMSDVVEVFDFVNMVWTLGNHLSVPRADHSATRLLNGNVLVAGGTSLDIGHPISSAETYNLNGTWTPEPAPMTSTRGDHTATLLQNGRVLIAGGYDDNLDSLASSELYAPDPDPAEGTWTAADTLDFGRYDHTQTVLPDGGILVIGGTGFPDPGSTAEIYNPATATWSQTTPPLRSRYRHTATLLPNGTVLVAGGSTATATEIYNPQTATWTAAGPLNKYRLLHTATLLSNGKVLVAGGSGLGGYLDSSEVFDPVTGMWTLIDDSMTKKRSTATATLLPNGKVLVAGGYGGPAPPVHSSSELFDPVAETWTATGSMTDARRWHTATLLPNGKVLVTGGQGSSTPYINTAELYDPATGLWGAAGSFTGARRQHTATLIPANGQVLITGGQGGGATAQLYDPFSGSWSAAANMGIPAHIGHTATVIPSSGKVLVVGGMNSPAARSAELYTPIIAD